MSVINADNAKGWQVIADIVSRQRPYPGRTATIIRGRKHKGEHCTVIRHMKDAYSDAFRYGGAANLHMREMQGRSGFVCQVRTDSGQVAWIKSDYLACDYAYKDPWEALADAVMIKR